MDVAAGGVVGPFQGQDHERLKVFAIGQGGVRLALLPQIELILEADSRGRLLEGPVPMITPKMLRSLARNW